MKLFLLGDTGLLGQAIAAHSSVHGEVCGFSSAPLPAGARSFGSHRVLRLPDSLAELESVIEREKPNALINTAAITSIPDCERDPAAAQRMNVDLPRGLAEICARTGTRFVHISTDQVFDGKKRTPYVETDATGALNLYGKSKEESEMAVLQANPEAVVVRTNILGFRGRSEKPATLGEWILKSYREKTPIALFDDYTNSSLHVEHAAEALHTLYGLDFQGIVHLGCGEPVSKFDLFQGLASRVPELKTMETRRSSMAKENFQPPRPSYLGLGVELARSLGIRIPTLHETLDRFAQDFHERLGEKS